MPKQAVLLLAHGTPETVDDIPEYLRNVVSGRPLPEHVIEEIKHRYSLIGRSPLTDITLEQGKLVEAELAMEGIDAQVYVGMRNWKPYIPDVVRKMRADGVEEAAVLCLAPQNSRTSVGLYKRAVQAEAGALKIDFTEGWAYDPLLADAFAERLRAAEEKLTSELGSPVPVLFTAHSVPCRTIQTPAANEGQPRHWPGEGVDPYAQEAKHTAELVAARVSGIPKWWFAFQSQGASGGPWIGPTVEDTLTSIAAEGVKTLLLQPIGFLCDHVEILYDVDIAFKEYAKSLAIQLERPESLNTSLTLARSVASLAIRGLRRLQENEPPLA
ncbi:ferrochelatase [Occallatibacter savannae]|uniref:ferrochelatase n=1 Tax=Occallatibacter savannae TaxID=1002691 RepID=UPI000D69558C|nr:ferrochelatase [Occallatibacter savannae]